MKGKLWGVMGAALLCFSFVPTTSMLFVMAGLIMIGVSLGMLQSPSLNHFLIAAVLSFGASVLFYFKLFAIFSSFFISLFSQNPFVPLTLSIGFYFLLYYLLQILSAVYFKKAFYSLGREYSNKFLKLSGNFLIAGAVLNIFFIGVVVWIVGWLLVLLGFFTLEDIVDVEIIEEEGKLLED